MARSPQAPRRQRPATGAEVVGTELSEQLHCLKDAPHLFDGCSRRATRGSVRTSDGRRRDSRVARAPRATPCDGRPALARRLPLLDHVARDGAGKVDPDVVANCVAGGGRRGREELPVDARRGCSGFSIKDRKDDTATVTPICSIADKVALPWFIDGNDAGDQSYLQVLA
ncbi:hypothetical protein ACP70R_021053 [Stipagrostis hirtigluma subsp. patula]